MAEAPSGERRVSGRPRMGDLWLAIVLVLAFGPLALMGALYVAALLLWLAGRPRFLATLVERTKFARLSKPAEKDE